MNRFAKRSLVRAGVLLALATLALGSPATAEDGPKPLPPQSRAYGKTLTEWLKLLDTWAYGGNQGDHVRNVRFLPQLIPVTDDPRLTEIDGFPFYVDEYELTVRPGTAFVVLVFGVVAETYNPVGGDPADDIHDPFIQDLLRETFGQLDAVVTLDGQPILDSAVENLTTFVSGPFDFNETLFYDVPKIGLVDPGPPPVYLTSYGAIAGQAMGFVLPPLPVGEHVLTIYSKDAFLFGNGTVLTYRITVRP
jgi:hypothetical protein